MNEEVPASLRASSVTTASGQRHGLMSDKRGRLNTDHVAIHNHVTVGTLLGYIFKISFSH